MSAKVAYTVHEAAEALGVSVDTVRRAAKSGSLEGKRLGENGGGPYLFSRAQLEDFFSRLRDA